MLRGGALIPVAVLALAVIGGGVAFVLRDGTAASGTNPEPDPYEASRACAADVQVRYKGKIFCPDTRVEVFKYAGIDAPDETGFDVALVIEAGRTATVLGPVPSSVDGSPSVARLRFDAQTWRDPDGGFHDLPAYEGTTHADYLRLLRN